MERIKSFSTVTNQAGEVFADDSIIRDENGVILRRTLSCYSSADLSLGTCGCHSHDPWTVTPLTIEDCTHYGYGVTLTPGEVFNQRLACLGLTLPDLEEFCRLSYRMDSNPLPKLRKLFPEIDVNFMYQDDGRKSFWAHADDDAPELVVELCDQRDRDGSLTVWIETYFD
jgi:hypothetical protein